MQKLDDEKISDETASFVSRGGTLLVASTEKKLGILNRAFGWKLATTSAGRLDRGGALLAYKNPDDECAHLFSDLPDSVPRGEAAPLDALSLPPYSRVLFGSSTIDAFFTPVGEGKVFYFGYHGYASDAHTPWKATLHKLLSGQKGFDI